jgi:hypothetical protein
MITNPFTIVTSYIITFFMEYILAGVNMVFYVAHFYQVHRLFYPFSQLLKCFTLLYELVAPFLQLGYLLVHSVLTLVQTVLYSPILLI